MGIAYVEHNISSDRAAKQSFLEKGYDLLPVFEIGDSVITDYAGEPMLIEILASEGYL